MGTGKTTTDLIRYRPAWAYSFTHSFIHIEHLYSASSRKLLRGAPDSSTAKKSGKSDKKQACTESVLTRRSATYPIYTFFPGSNSLNESIPIVKA